jgi:hypothetical protein
MERTLTLRADANDLKPFEVMAKKMGIYVKSEKQDPRWEIFWKLTKRGYDWDKAVKVVGLTEEMINEWSVAEVKAYRREKRAKECAQ